MGTKRPRIVSNKLIVRMLNAAASEQTDEEKKQVLTNPEKVTVLDLSEIEAEGIDEEAFSGFDALHKLNLSNNNLTTVGAAFQNKPPEITWLKLSHNSLTRSGASGLRSLSHLTTLALSYNKLDAVPRKALRGMPQLKALVLDHNQITKVRLPSELKGLTTLILSHNQISELSVSELEKIPKVTKVSISNNELREFPSFIHNSKLAEIKMAHNQVSKIAPGSFHNSGISNLRVLDLSSNKFEEWDNITAGLNGAEQLLSLGLRHNPMSQHGKDGDDSDGAKKLDSQYASKVVSLFPNVKLIDYRKVETYNIEGQSSNAREFQNEWRRKDVKRKKNLVSTKLQQPDKSKPRNKPCSCGSGIKYKLCCEKKDKDPNHAPNVKDVTTAQQKEPKVVDSKQKSKGTQQSEDASPPIVRKPSKKVKATKSATLQVVDQLVGEIMHGTSNDNGQTPSEESSAGQRKSKRKAEDQEVSDSTKLAKVKKNKLLETLAKADPFRGSGVVNVVQNKRRNTKQVVDDKAAANRVKVTDGAELAKMLKASEPVISAWD